MSRVLPILFNTEMVKSILDNRKSCTRRLVKPQLPQNVIEIHEIDPMGYLMFKTDDRLLDGWRNRKSPYQVGDILYVRETWCDRWLPDGFLQDADRYGYKANGIPTIGYWGNDKQCKDNVWIPSIHMPKEAARIWLKVTDVRVERLQDITEEQAIKEGFAGERCNHAGLGEHGCTDCMNTGWIEPPQVGFMYTWNSTVSEDWKKWESNPYVWIIEFERCENPEQGL